MFVFLIKIVFGFNFIPLSLPPSVPGVPQGILQGSQHWAVEAALQDGSAAAQLAQRRPGPHQVAAELTHRYTMNHSFSPRGGKPFRPGIVPQWRFLTVLINLRFEDEVTSQNFTLYYDLPRRAGWTVNREMKRRAERLPPPETLCCELPDAVGCNRGLHRVLKAQWFKGGNFSIWWSLSLFFITYFLFLCMNFFLNIKERKKEKALDKSGQGMCVFPPLTWSWLE